MVSPPEKGGLNDERDVENNIIIIDSMIRNILPPKMETMSARNKVMCGCECLISAKSMH